MLIMKWKTDNEGRLVAAWEENRECRTTVPCARLVPTRQETIQHEPAKGLQIFISRRRRTFRYELQL